MSKRVTILSVALGSVILATLLRAEAAPSDEQARALAIETVAKETGIPNAELNTRRIEELEDNFFSAQEKVKGRIRKGAYFYLVENGGDQIAPDKVTYRAHSAQNWYVAVSTSDGETFGLYGFKDAEAGFQRLVSKIPVEVLDTSQAQTFAKFYLESVYQARASIVYDELRLKHKVEEHFVGYADTQEPTAKKEQRFSRWWNAFERTKAGPLEPSVKIEDENHYRVATTILEMTIGRPPEVWEWFIEIQRDGAARLADKRLIFPARHRTRHDAVRPSPDPRS